MTFIKGEGGLTFGGEGTNFWWGNFSRWEAGNEQIFDWCGRLMYMYYKYTYIKELCQQVFTFNEEAPCTSRTSCAQVAILLLQDLSTLSVTDIYGIYFHLSLQCS